MASQALTPFGDSISWASQQNNQITIANTFLGWLLTDEVNAPLACRWGKQWLYVVEAEATMRHEYLPRLVQFGLPEDAACFEGELAGLLGFFLGFSRAPILADCLLVSSQSPRTIPTAPGWASSSARSRTPS